MSSLEITQSLLHNLIFYNYVTGECQWRVRAKKYFKNNQSYSSWNNKYSHKLIGTISENKSRYKRLQTSIFGKTYKLHRLIWFLEGSMKKKKKVIDLVENTWFKDLVHLRRIDNSARNPNRRKNLTVELLKEINTLIGETNEQKS